MDRERSPMPRRGFLNGLATLPLIGGSVATAAVASASAAHDTVILDAEKALAALQRQSTDILRERVVPFEARYREMLPRKGMSAAEGQAAWLACCAYSHSVGREAAIDEANALLDQGDALVRLIMRTRAATQAGRQAKVRVVMAHLAPDMRGPVADLNWDAELIRTLFAEYAGMSEADLAAI